MNKPNKTEVNLLNIDRQSFRQLNVPGITLKCYDAINDRRQSHAFNTLNDVVSFFTQYKGRIIKKKHLSKWHDCNLIIKIDTFKIDTDLLNIVHTRLKYLKYNTSLKGWKRYKTYYNNSKHQQQHKQYNNTKETIKKYKTGDKHCVFVKSCNNSSKINQYHHQNLCNQFFESKCCPVDHHPILKVCLLKTMFFVFYYFAIVTVIIMFVNLLYVKYTKF